MATRNQKIHGIIHVASAACAGVGAGLAQLPGSDAVVIVPIQTAMIMSIASQHGVELTKTLATDFILTSVATTGGRFLSQLFLGWIPVLGNAINASTAAGVTEAIGWAADRYFAKTDEKTKGGQ